MSYRKISDEINKDEYMKKNDKSLSHMSISNILKDESKKKQKIKRVKDKIKKSKKQGNRYERLPNIDAYFGKHYGLEDVKEAFAERINGSITVYQGGSWEIDCSGCN